MQDLLFLALAVIILRQATFTECCFRASSSNDDSEDTPESNAIVDERDITSNSNSGSSNSGGVTMSPIVRLDCTAAESRSTRCLNRGTCFAVMISGERKLACHCQTGYRGKRCEEKLSDGCMVQDDGTFVCLSTASAASQALWGILIAIFVLLVIGAIVALSIFLVRRKRQGLSPWQPRHAPADLQSAFNSSLTRDNNNLVTSSPQRHGDNDSELQYFITSPLRHSQVSIATGVK